MIYGHLIKESSTKQRFSNTEFGQYLQECFEDKELYDMCKIVSEGGCIGPISEASMEDKIKKYIDKTDDLIASYKKNKSKEKPQDIISGIGLGIAILSVLVGGTMPITGLVLSTSALVSVIINNASGFYASRSAINSLLIRVRSLRKKAKDPKQKKTLETLEKKIENAIRKIDDEAKYKND